MSAFVIQKNVEIPPKNPRGRVTGGPSKYDDLINSLKVGDMVCVDRGVYTALWAACKKKGNGYKFTTRVTGEKDKVNVWRTA